MGKRRYLTEETAINYLRAFFADTSGNKIRPNDIFAAAGRATTDAKKNRSWLSYMLTAMKEYDFFTRQYSKGGKLSSLTLTEKGKKALGRGEVRSISTNRKQADKSDEQQQLEVSDSVDAAVLLETVKHQVEVLQRKLPSFEVTFDVKPKGVIR